MNHSNKINKTIDTLSDSERVSKFLHYHPRESLNQIVFSPTDNTSACVQTHRNYQIELLRISNELADMWKWLKEFSEDQAALHIDKARNSILLSLRTGEEINQKDLDIRAKRGTLES